jgi:hypothetical protein
MKVVNGVAVPELGESAFIEAAGHVDEVTIVGQLGAGRVVVEFKSGSRLVCGLHHLATQTHQRHRASDPDTSRTAARAQSENLTLNQMLVLKALVAAGDRGLIDHEHEPINGLWQDTAGKRRKELEAAEMCRDSGRRRPSPRNRPAAVHVVTGTGIAVYNAARARGVA